MKTISRKNFFKKVCLTGICMCGFSSIAMSKSRGETEQTNGKEDDKLALIQNWIAQLLGNIDQELDEEAKRTILKSCSIAHYNSLKMNDVLLPYIGNLEAFIGFLEEKWGWKITYNQKTKTLLADENKNYCVCPIINSKSEGNKSAICYCSEGFAEKMFSSVAKVPAKATVISSVHQGGETCVYKIEFNNR